MSPTAAQNCTVTGYCHVVRCLRAPLVHVRVVLQLRFSFVSSENNTWGHVKTVRRLRRSFSNRSKTASILFKPFEHCVDPFQTNRRLRRSFSNRSNTAPILFKPFEDCVDPFQTVRRNLKQPKTLLQSVPERRCVSLCSSANATRAERCSEDRAVILVDARYRHPSCLATFRTTRGEVSSCTATRCAEPAFSRRQTTLSRARRVLNRRGRPVFGRAAQRGVSKWVGTVEYNRS